MITMSAYTMTQAVGAEHYAIPGGLLDLCDSFCDLAERIKGELSRANRKMFPLPQIAAETERRAA